MQRTFTMQDQLQFARLSGDFNPMHVDEVAARRFMFGRPVVHGIHVLLWGLDQLLAGRSTSDPLAIVSLRTTFSSPVIVGEPVRLAITPGKGDGKWKLEVSSDHARLATTVVTLDVPANESADVSTNIPPHGVCRELRAGDLPGVSGRIPLYLPAELAAQFFPHAIQSVPRDQLAALLATTRLVGMETPGLNSLFTGLELKRCDAAEIDMRYRVEEFDERFSMLGISITAPGLIGKISAALRPAPARQTTMTELKSLVKPGEFACQRTLVIGGSRGLGEVVVKELARGGADVRFTFHKGETEAQKIIREISAAGGSAECFRFDIATDAVKLATLLKGWSPTALYYFATPFIFSAVAGRFSPELFRTFCDCYVQQFLQIFTAVEAISPQLAAVLHPSSSALDELPANMVEYTAAKGAAESLCHFLAKSRPKIRFSIPRLPRLATDQTATLLHVDTPDTAVHMLQLLREMNPSEHV